MAFLSIENLVQRPKKWTRRHLEYLSVQEHHYHPAAAVVGHAHLPSDDDPSKQPPFFYHHCLDS